MYTSMLWSIQLHFLSLLFTFILFSGSHQKSTSLLPAPAWLDVPVSQFFFWLKLIKLSLLLVEGKKGKRKRREKEREKGRGGGRGRKNCKQMRSQDDGNQDLNVWLYLPSNLHGGWINLQFSPNRQLGKDLKMNVINYTVSMKQSGSKTVMQSVSQQQSYKSPASYCRMVEWTTVPILAVWPKLAFISLLVLCWWCIFTFILKK